MQESRDSGIRELVRLLLAKESVDLRQMTISATNGVVRLGGELRLTESETPAQVGGATWIKRIRREISTIPDVDIVVFQFHELQEPLRRWEAPPAGAAVPRMSPRSVLAE